MTGGGCASWLELESDPGLFTLLVDDFGVKGVQVEEIYDLTKPLESSVFGFIFLFKWVERRSRRSKAAALDGNSNYVTDPSVVNRMFFAHQIVPNSCATHALLSVLLNCETKKRPFELGESLSKFQSSCAGLTPEVKGLAIGNQPGLAAAHNSYAKPETAAKPLSNHSTSTRNSSSSLAALTSTPAASFLAHTASSSSLSALSAASTGGGPGSPEIFHFICFVPINGRLYELDGLKPYPVDHGSVYSSQWQAKSLNWTVKFKQIIQQRLSSFNNGTQNHEIRFNLMAVVPDKMLILKQKLELMNKNLRHVREYIESFKQSDAFYAACGSKARLGLTNGVHEAATTTNGNGKSTPPETTLLANGAAIKCENGETSALVDTEAAAATLRPNLPFYLEQHNYFKSTENEESFEPEKSAEPEQNGPAVATTTPTTTTTTTTRQLRSRSLGQLKVEPKTNSNEQERQASAELESDPFWSQLPEFRFEVFFDLASEIAIDRAAAVADTINYDYYESLTDESVKLAFLNDYFDLRSLVKQFEICEIHQAADACEPALHQNGTGGGGGDGEDEVLLKVESEARGEGDVKEESTRSLVRKSAVSFRDLREVELKLAKEIEQDETRLTEELEKRKKYRIDAQRRKHLYDEFIITYLRALAESGQLVEALKSGSGLGPVGAASGRGRKKHKSGRPSNVSSLSGGSQQQLSKRVRRK